LAGRLQASTFSVPAPAYLPGGFSPNACVGYRALSPIRSFTVFIDPGHGGADTGTYGVTPSGQLNESTVTLAVAMDLLSVLRQSGFNVVMSRVSDTTVANIPQDQLAGGVLSPTQSHLDEQARVACANAAGADALISIHMNGFDDPSATGAHIFYCDCRDFSAKSQLLATLLQAQILGSLNALGASVPDRGVLPDTGQGGRSAEVPADYHHLFLLGPAEPSYNDDPSAMPGALMEPLYLTNPQEAAIAADPVGQKAMANGIATGLSMYADKTAQDSARKDTASTTTRRS
jgi:N-acetylmuramoyl-L-alanine amidase